jgi:hypothetical protein
MPPGISVVTNNTGQPIKIERAGVLDAETQVQLGQAAQDALEVLRALAERHQRRGKS